MQKFYRFLHSDAEVRKKSSSGGAFTFFSDIVLNSGGVIYGCILDENLKAVHVRATNAADRDKMRVSKYIQSDMHDILPRIRQDLENGHSVLFTGTPCQVFAVSCFLEISNIKTTNLILLEVVCHGVGSNKFFYDYIDDLERRYRSDAVSVNFRAKRHKGQKQDMEVRFKNDKKYHASSTRYDWFYSAYLRNLILRPSCYECKFAKNERYADLTIADHWGYKDDDSFSLIVSNSEKGEKILQQVIDQTIVEINCEEVKQPHMQHPCAKPKDREIFWHIYLKHGYLSAQKWLGNNTIKGKAKDMLVRMAYSLHLANCLKKIRK